MIGKKLGHYRILAKLGAGGMGVVYRAHDERLDRDVALKLLPAPTLADDTARVRLLREARAVAALNHPHICTVHEVGEADGQTYIAMEYIEGEPLTERVRGQGLLAGAVLRYGCQIADALMHAHERGIVHRDLKSANVVITPEGRAKVLDFGLAKRFSGEELAEATTQSEASLTQAGAVMGTLPYMAPEQLRGQAADARSDVWALGVVLYEMAAGQRPFRGETGYELSGAILRDSPPPLPPTVPSGLQAVIERCLEKEPARRYQRGSEVRAALEAVQAGVAVVPWLWRVRRLRRRHFLAGAGALALLVATTVWWTWLGAGSRSVPRHSIAVLPLENLSGDPEQDYFAAGMHEALITDLAKLGGFQRVIARSSVMRYRHSDKPLPQIARELGVDAVVTGAVLRSGDRVRVTAQLINAATEENLWADRYERELRDVLPLQSEIVRAIAGEIELKLTPQEQARLSRARPVNPEAYDAYLKGKFYLNRFTPEGFQKGLAYLQQAIEKDPANPLPYAGLALGYSLIGHGPAPPADAFVRAKVAAVKALELDETLAEAHAALAEIKLYEDWDLGGAGEEFRRALELNPSFAEAHRHYSWYLLLPEPMDLDQAFAEMKRAQQLDPLTPLYYAELGWQYWWAAQYDKAIEEALKSLELNPDFPVGLYVLGAVYAEEGMFQEAIRMHQKAGAISPAWRLPLARTYAQAGRRDEARRMLADLGAKPSPRDGWWLAEAYAALGDKDKAFGWLETAYESHHTWMPWLRHFPTFKPLRDDPRFQGMVRRITPPR